MKNWITHQAKKTICYKLFKNRFDEYDQLLYNCLSIYSYNSIWVYTLMKSGTTYSLLFLANYLNYIGGGRNGISYDEMQSKYILHSLDIQICRNNLTPFLNMKKESKGIEDYPNIIHTHSFIETDLWLKNISLYRNPLDYIVSSYYYWYINRGKNVEHPMVVYKEILNHFIKTYNHQKQLKSNYAYKVLQISYESLIKQTNEVFSQMIKFIELPYDARGIEHAILFSSKKEVKKMEQQRGEAIVKGDGVKFTGSFVRSGKIGEWKEYFNEKDLIEIDNYLTKESISINDFILE